MGPPARVGMFLSIVRSFIVAFRSAKEWKNATFAERKATLFFRTILNVTVFEGQCYGDDWGLRIRDGFTLPARRHLPRTNLCPFLQLPLQLAPPMLFVNRNALLRP